MKIIVYGHENAISIDGKNVRSYTFFLCGRLRNSMSQIMLPLSIYIQGYTVVKERLSNKYLSSQYNFGTKKIQNAPKFKYPI